MYNTNVSRVPEQTLSTGQAPVILAPSFQTSVFSHTPDISIFQFKKLVNIWERTLGNVLKMYGMSCRVVLLAIAAMGNVQTILCRSSHTERVCCGRDGRALNSYDCGNYHKGV